MGRNMTRYYHPANGQCVCKIHEEFERVNGITVDQWYAQNPQVTPWWMESCGRCDHCPAKTTQAVVSQPVPVQEEAPAQPVKPIVQPVAAEPTPVRRSDPVSAQAAKPSVKEETIVREPVYTEKTEPAPTYHWDTTPTADPLVGALLKGSAITLGLGAATLFLLVFGLAILVAIPITMALIITWNRRAAIGQAIKSTTKAIDAALMAPFALVWKLATKAAQRIKARQAQPIKASNVLMLPGPAPITNPARLLEANYSEPIAFTARPVPVAISRKSKKVKVKHGNQ